MDIGSGYCWQLHIIIPIEYVFKLDPALRLGDGQKKIRAGCDIM